LRVSDQGWVEPVELLHADAKLVPLERGHAGELATAAESLETFALFSRGPETLDEVGMDAFVAFLLKQPRTVPFCVIEPGSGRAVGITTYLDIREAHRGLEIGWTWYTPRLRGTKLNPACKLLLLEHAFDRLGAIRVCLKTDERNGRSRAAILKLGAKFEGVMRDTVIMRDGFRRSSAMYSVLAGEWAEVRRGLEARLRLNG
jgi:N-acetyltransferase